MLTAVRRRLGEAGSGRDELRAARVQKDVERCDRLIGAVVVATAVPVDLATAGQERAWVLALFMPPNLARKASTVV